MAKSNRSDDTLRLEPAAIREYERLRGQLKTFYDEVTHLSKKSPDGAMNKFKLKFINATLKSATALLGDRYRPFAEFEVFADDELPTTSDVGMMLAQYLESMDRFKRAHTFREAPGYTLYWSTKGDEPVEA